MEKLIGLLGYPLGHTMSPLIHNDAFASLDIPASYHAFEVHPNHLEEAITGIRALNLAGCNVTIPHKVAVMAYLDHIDDEALAIGAVNTIVNRAGKLMGYNTDGRGYYESLIQTFCGHEHLADKRVLIIGAGGAARAIVTVFAREKAGAICIANRTMEKAERLANLQKHTEADIEAVTLVTASEQVESFDIIINTTSVGMSPNQSESPLALSRLKSQAIVSDLIYNPIETKLLREAKLAGARTLDGVGMFVNQGALSFEYWTGQKPDRERMRQLVYEELGGKKRC